MNLDWGAAGSHSDNAFLVSRQTKASHCDLIWSVGRAKRRRRFGRWQPISKSKAVLRCGLPPHFKSGPDPSPYCQLAL